MIQYVYSNMHTHLIRLCPCGLISHSFRNLSLLPSGNSCAVAAVWAQLRETLKSWSRGQYEWKQQSQQLEQSILWILLDDS